MLDLRVPIWGGWIGRSNKVNERLPSVMAIFSIVMAAYCATKSTVDSVKTRGGGKKPGAFTTVAISRCCHSKHYNPDFRRIKAVSKLLVHFTSHSHVRAIIVRLAP